MCNGLSEGLLMSGGCFFNALGLGIPPQQITCTQENMSGARALSVQEIQDIQIRQASGMLNAYMMRNKKKLPPIPPRACPLHWRKPEDRA